MAEEEPKKVESEAPSEPKVEPEAPSEPKVEHEAPSEPPAPVLAETVEEPAKDVPDEKAVIPAPEEKPEYSKALAVIEKAPETTEAKSGEGSVNRDAVLARVATEKRLSLIRAWEESEKTKAENKAQKKLSSVGSWENSQKATIEAELKKIEENLEKKKAAYVEKMQNKIALLHKTAEEQRAVIEAKRGEELLKAEEKAAKYRATGTAPKKLLGIF